MKLTSKTVKKASMKSTKAKAKGVIEPIKKAPVLTYPILPVEINELIAAYLDVCTYLKLRLVSRQFLSLNPNPVLHFETFREYFLLYPHITTEITLSLRFFKDAHFTFLKNCELSSQFCRALAIKGHAISDKAKLEAMEHLVCDDELGRQQDMILALLRDKDGPRYNVEEPELAHYACEFGSVPIMNAIINQWQETKSSSVIQNTDLMSLILITACTNGNDEIVRILLKRTAIDFSQSEPLLVASNTNNWNCLDVLLKDGRFDLTVLGAKLLENAVRGMMKDIVFQLLDNEKIKFKGIDHHQLLKDAQYDIEVLKRLVSDSRFNAMDLFKEDCNVSKGSVKLILSGERATIYNRMIVSMHAVRSRNLDAFHWVLSMRDSDSININVLLRKRLRHAWPLEDLFLQAVRNSDREVMQVLIDHGVNVKTDGCEALFIACHLCCQSYAVLTLLKGKIDFFARSGLAVEESIKEGLVESLRIMLEQAGTYKWMDGLILYSIAGEDPTILQILLQDGRFDPSYHNNEALFLALGMKSNQFARMLLGDSRVKAPFQALLTACRAADLELVRMIILQVDPSFNDSEALSIAIKNRDISLVRLLAKDSRVNPNGRKLLDLAVTCGPFESVRLVLSNPKTIPTSSSIVGCNHEKIVALVMYHPDFSYGDHAAKVFDTLLNLRDGEFLIFIEPLFKAMTFKQRAISLMLAVDFQRWDIVLKCMNLASSLSKESLYDTLKASLLYKEMNVYRILIGIIGVGPIIQKSLDLQMAIQENKIDYVKKAVAEDATILTFDSYWLVRVMAKSGNIAMLKVAFETKLVQPGFSNSLLLQTAVMASNLSMVQYLLQFPSVDPSAKNQECMKVAIGQDNQMMISLLLLDERVNDLLCSECGEYHEQLCEGESEVEEVMQHMG